MHGTFQECSDIYVIQKIGRLHITSPAACWEGTKCEICPAQPLISWIYVGLKWTNLWQSAQYYMEIRFLHMNKFSKLRGSTTTSLNVSVGCRSVKWIWSWHYILPTLQPEENLNNKSFTWQKVHPACIDLLWQPNPAQLKIWILTPQSCGAWLVSHWSLLIYKYKHAL